jgi:hypothetical protein
VLGGFGKAVGRVGIRIQNWKEKIGFIEKRN